MHDASEDGPVSTWARDGALTVFGANAGATVAIAIAIALKAPAGQAIARLVDLRFFQVCLAQHVSGLVLGACAGWVLRALWVRSRAWWWALLFAGFPVGSLIAVCEAFAVTRWAEVSSSDEQGFLWLGLLAGGAVGGPLWAVYALLRATGRPALGVALLAPHLSALITGGALVFVIWLLN